jgi:ornithine carbamoyltransferase
MLGFKKKSPYRELAEVDQDLPQPEVIGHSDEARQAVVKFEEEKRIRLEKSCASIVPSEFWAEKVWPKIHEGSLKGHQITWVHDLSKNLADALVLHAQKLGYDAYIEGDGDLRIEWRKS